MVDVPLPGKDPELVTGLTVVLFARKGGRFVGIYRAGR